MRRQIGPDGAAHAPPATVFFPIKKRIVRHQIALDAAYAAQLKPSHEVAHFLVHEKRIAIALQINIPSDDAVSNLALRVKIGGEAIVRPQARERGGGREEFDVRRGYAPRGGVMGVKRLRGGNRTNVKTQASWAGALPLDGALHPGLEDGLRRDAFFRSDPFFRSAPFSCGEGVRRAQGGEAQNNRPNGEPKKPAR